MGYDGGYGGYGGYGGHGGMGGCANLGGYQPCDMGCEIGHSRGGNTFALIVVLFILLIIIGSQFHKKC